MLGTTIQNVVYLGDLLPGICAPWLAKGMCLDFQQEQEICHFSTVSSPVLGSTQLLLQLVLGVLYPEVKWLGHEADQSSPCSAEVKNVWSCISTLLYASMAWCLIKLRDNFFYLTV
jgi:hypothetical protein